MHYDSPDRRGVDVGFLYNPRLFQVVNTSVHPFRWEKNLEYTSRDQLLVSGMLAGEPVHIVVGHWPSRYGAKSSELREAAAATALHIADSLYNVRADAKVIIMGDFNDDPTDKSCRRVLGAKKHPQEVTPGGLYNTMWKLFEKGVGSLCYQGKWNLFDQIVVSYPLLGSDYSNLKFWKAEVFNRDFLIQQEGKNKGYPHRTFSANTFINGYSDHFPTLIYLIREQAR